MRPARAAKPGPALVWPPVAAGATLPLTERELPVSTIWSFNIGINATVFGSAQNKPNPIDVLADVVAGTMLFGRDAAPMRQRAGRASSALAGKPPGKINTGDLQWEMRCEIQCNALTRREKSRRRKNNGKQ
jgi:hypothetical protein